ncbi:MAG: Xaa-Pro peptidase family protein [Verrucomicrobiota bacterium]|nr:Xaa-Pro peptidase family protein [Verrucomicrobiota bacterium]
MNSSETDILIIADSDRNADMLYASGIFIPDAFTFFRVKGKTVIIVNDLEIDRARRDARVDLVLSYSDLEFSFKTGQKKKRPSYCEVVAASLKYFKAKRFFVPPTFPYKMALDLRKQGIVTVPVDAIFPKREFKTENEIKLIGDSLRLTEAGMLAAYNLIKNSSIKGRFLEYKGEKVTSEMVRAEIDTTIARRGGLASNTIVACGNQACDPHERGHGSLYAGETIIVDIFPRHQGSGYYGDMTRTWVRGKASSKLKKMYKVVRQGQQIAYKGMRPGQDGALVHESIKAYFAEQGFPTERVQGRQSGFFHGTGHGLGLDIHEEPRFGKTQFKKGQVITVEPGLYYCGLGGIRVEDVAVVTGKGAKVISKFHYTFEI